MSSKYKKGTKNICKKWPHIAVKYSKKWVYYLEKISERDKRRGSWQWVQMVGIAYKWRIPDILCDESKEQPYPHPRALLTPPFFDYILIIVSIYVSMHYTCVKSSSLVSYPLIYLDLISKDNVHQCTRITYNFCVKYNSEIYQRVKVQLQFDNFEQNSTITLSINIHILNVYTILDCSR